jgi:hypothetical protein
MRTFVVLALLGVLAGCSARGAAFSATESVPADKVLIVFYRPGGFVGGGVSPMLVDNGAQVQRIQNGQFINYMTTPGAHKLHTDTMAIDKVLEFNAEAGQTYYVKLILQQGAWTSSWSLGRAFPEEALAELKTCCKSGE